MALLLLSEEAKREAESSRKNAGFEE